MTSPAGFGQDIIGWDIGGAHLKAARLRAGRVVEVVQEACPLWQGMAHLDTAFDAILGQLGGASLHAVTMTGELTDFFASRQDGVEALAVAAAGRIGPVSIYAGRAGFVGVTQAGDHAADIASANWHATASWAAAFFRDGILADMGSTTTDLIPLVGGKIADCGYSDAERLESGALVYSGALRTSLMALSPAAPVGGRMRRVMAEHFATMADVNRLLGRIDPATDQYPAADGMGKSAAETARRLARLVGEDELTESQARALADWFAEIQLRMVHDAAATLISAIDMDEGAPVILCGAGSATLELLAARLRRPAKRLAAAFPLEFQDDRLAVLAETCAPAVAVALLMTDHAL